jgi:hypothetical protein
LALHIILKEYMLLNMIITKYKHIKTFYNDITLDLTIRVLNLGHNLPLRRVLKLTKRIVANLCCIKVLFSIDKYKF